MSKDYVFLVAVQVSVPDGVPRKVAAREMLRMLPRPGENMRMDNATLECWWLAEDDRIDGSDNDSAVFVHPGAQKAAFDLLYAAGLTAECNNPLRDNNKGPEYRVSIFEEE